MWHKVALVLGSAILAGSVLSTSYAEDQQQKPAEQAAPSGQGMMGNHEMTGQVQRMMGSPEMTAQMQRMMANPEMAAQMRQMMENCSKMMESMIQQSPATPTPEKGG
jgi:hypothetical protein